MKLSKINPEIELRKKLNSNKKNKKSTKTDVKKEITFDIKHIIIDCSCMNYIDSMGMNVILQV
jgi:anti-anti-sigma regulatory factor